MFCPKCGTQLNDNMLFCSKCGTKIEQADNEKQPDPPPPPPPPPPPVSNSPSESPPPVSSSPPTNSKQMSPPKQQPVQAKSNNSKPDQSSHYEYLRKPMSVGGYLLFWLVYCIPIVNVIMIFVWAFGSSVNINKKNLARAILILFILGIIFTVIMIVFAGVIFAPFLDSLSESDAISELLNSISDFFSEQNNNSFGY